MTFILKDRLPPTVSGKRRSSSHAGGGEVGGRGGGGWKAARIISVIKRSIDRSFSRSYSNFHKLSQVGSCC